MKEFLVFDLYGPMSAWGDIAVGEQRPSFGQPTKSAILGLLAAAMGIRRNDDMEHNQLQMELGFAVRVNHGGVLLRDYHTTQVPSQKKGKIFYCRYDETNEDSLNTILSQRDYRTDASYTIALWLREDQSTWTLKDFKQALLKPVFTLYLGRKSCPLALPLKPQIIDSDNLYQALLQVDSHNNFLMYLPKSETVSIYYEGFSLAEAGIPKQALHWQSSRRDAIASRKRWQFKERQEHYASIPLRGD